MGDSTATSRMALFSQGSREVQYREMPDLLGGRAVMQ
jgi:hypothetical protein